MSGFFKRMTELMGEGLTSAEIESRLLHEFAGERVYICKRDQHLHEKIAARHTGNNTAKITRELRVSKRTVYRVIRLRRRMAKNER